MTHVSRYHEIDVSKPMTGLRYEKSNGLALITIDRRERGNALAPSMHATFRAVWSDIRDDPAVRVAIVTGAGEKHFCTGFDVATQEETSEVFINQPLSESVFWSPYQNRVWKPVIAAVNGLCVGGGHHFVVDADIILASRNASFVDTHVNVGMVGAIENIGLAKRLPLGTALRMTLQGKHFRLGAERAHQLGLVDELVDTPADLLPLAETMALQMAGNSPQAMALSKQAIWSGVEQGYTQALEKAWALLRLHWMHPDFTEGPAAFGEKRVARWNPDPNAGIPGAKSER
ncbi:MAG: enoyl-CoA hydratase/isomerase family protein [bacterium]